MANPVLNATIAYFQCYNTVPPLVDSQHQQRPPTLTWPKILAVTKYECVISPDCQRPPPNLEFLKFKGFSHCG